MDAFAARLRADRERAGLTVRELAARSQISFSYITKIETGRSGKGVSPEIVSALAEAVGCDELEYLHVADVIPPPLKDLLANPQSRSFVRSLLQLRPKPAQWNRLEMVLAESTEEYSVASGKSGRNVGLRRK